MRIATVAVVTSVVTIAIGGMLAFCRAEGPAVRNADAEKASPSSSAESAIDDAPSAPAAPTTRRWGEPEPAPVSPATVLAEELSAIRDRVGSVLPESWEAFGATEHVDRSKFAETVEALEANAAPHAVPTAFPHRVEAGPAWLPPAPADPANDDLRSESSPVASTTEPPMFEPDVQYLPSGPATLGVDSPEPLAELTKLLSVSARDLERLAHSREEQRRYHEADRLRRLATQLRRENRRILSERMPNPETAGPNVSRRY